MAPIKRDEDPASNYIVDCFLRRTVPNYGEKFVILTFVSYRNKDGHPTATHHWIIPVDSIKGKNDYKTYPVYLKLEYSSDSFDKCCGSEAVDFITTATATKYEYTEEHKKQQEILLKMVQNNRKPIQTIIKNWDGGYKEKIKIYATPLTGDFCNCRVYARSLNFTDGKNIIYLPYNGNQGFWSTDLGKDVQDTDYSNIKYRNYH